MYLEASTVYQMRQQVVNIAVNNNQSKFSD